MKPTVYILLPVFNRKNVTERFLSQIKDQTYPVKNILVMDDGSTDGTMNMIREQFPECEVFHGGNLWWAGSLQFLVEQLKKRDLSPDSLILIINDDVEIPDDYLELAVRIMEANSNCLLGSVLKWSDDPAQDEYGVVFDLEVLRVRSGHQGEEINCLATRGLFLRWKDFATIGEFKPQLLPHYFSDYEFTIRAHQKGFRLLVDPSVWVRTTGQVSGLLPPSQKGLLKTLKFMFSNLNRMNPLHFSIFIMMRCPGYRKFAHQRSVLGGMYKDLETGLKPWQARILRHLIVDPVRLIRWMVRLPRRVVRKIYRVLFRPKANP
jgi:glycosyltransferase involved in cell wall biosynthesis